MQKQFWNDKWEKNETGFHLSKPHPWLKKFYSNIFSSAEKIFVPLCGKTPDMAFFANQNNPVLGVEFSEIAAKDFFQEQFPKSDHFPVATQERDFICYQMNGVKILCGDFFQLTSSHLGNTTHLYDRAALVALPDNMRVDYVEHLRKIMPHVKMFLITLHYNQEAMQGPPFSVTPSETERLFSFADIQQLDRKNIIDKEPKFKSRGLTAFYETAYMIEW